MPLRSKVDAQKAGAFLQSECDPSSIRKAVVAINSCTITRLVGRNGDADLPPLAVRSLSRRLAVLRPASREYRRTDSLCGRTTLPVTTRTPPPHDACRAPRSGRRILRRRAKDASQEDGEEDAARNDRGRPTRGLGRTVPRGSPGRGPVLCNEFFLHKMPRAPVNKEL